eukprot:1417656-Alexandrium_andersonii.AAC.1
MRRAPRLSERFRVLAVPSASSDLGTPIPLLGLQKPRGVRHRAVHLMHVASARRGAPVVKLAPPVRPTVLGPRSNPQRSVVGWGLPRLRAQCPRRARAAR